MPSMSSRLEVTPSGSQAFQSPFQVGGPGGVDFGSLLQQQLAMRQRMNWLKEQQIREQLKQGREAWQLQKNQMRKAGKGKQGLGRGDPLMHMYKSALAQSTPPRGPSDFRGYQRQVQALQEAGQLAGMMGGGGGGGGFQMTQQPGMPSLGQQAMAQRQGQLQANLMPEWMLQQAQQPVAGASAEKGGKVPKTGMYKLHEGETVLNKKMSDVMFPYMGKASKGKKSFQGGSIPTPGTPGMLGDPSIAEYLLGLIKNLTGRGPGALVPQEPEPGVPAGPTPLEPISPGLARELPEGFKTPMEMEIPGLEERRGVTEGRGDRFLFGELVPGQKAGEPVRKDILKGEKETESERMDRWREEMRENEEEAELQNARLNLLMSYFAGQPEKMDDPRVKALFAQRQFLAKGYEAAADKRKKQIEKIEQQEKKAETLKEIQRIEAGGRGEAERIKGEAKMRDTWQKSAMDLSGTLDQIQQDYAAGSGDEQGDDRLYYDRMHTALAMYYPLLSQKLGIPMDELRERMSTWIGQSLEDPSMVPQMLMLINSVIGQ